MKNKDRLVASLVLQTFLGGLLIYGLMSFSLTNKLWGWDLFNVLFSLLDHGVLLRACGIIFLMQCIDAWELYPNRRKRIKYYFISVGVLSVIGVCLTFWVQNDPYTMGFGAYLLQLLVFFGGAILAYVALFFIPFYYLKTLRFNIKMVLPLKNNSWEETDVLDWDRNNNHFFNQK